MSYASCDDISELCPVEATVYGYLPNLGGNCFFLIAFIILLVAQIHHGVRHRTWTWLAIMFVGIGLEIFGYIGRLIMANNPWSSLGFRMQLACLIIAPSFISASIDLVLKHIVLVFGSEYSRIPAKYYAWLFIGADVFSIFLQAIGGGLASASDNPELFNAGNNLMLTGICIQVAQLVAFATVSAEYGYRTYKNRQTLVHYQEVSKDRLRKIKLFIFACSTAFVAILTRCIYRIPELSQGWGGALMRDEASFLVLDGTMVLLASIVLTIWHPGTYFPAMAGQKLQKTAQREADVPIAMSSV